MAQPNFPILLQNLNALNQATGNVALELSRLPNIPAINIAVQLNNILRNQQQIMRIQQADHRRLRRLRRLRRRIRHVQHSIQALDTRSFCRTMNSHISTPVERIQVLPNLRNVLPNNFPANVGQLRRANAATINNFLAFYGLQGAGALEARRRLLAEYIGIRLL